MYPYVLLTTIAGVSILYKVFLLLINKPDHNRFDVVFLSILYIGGVLVSGLRFETGGDYEGYRLLYESIEWSDFNFSNNGVGWQTYELIFKSIGLSFNSFILVNSVISNLLIFLSIKKLSPNKNILIFSVAIFYLLAFYSMEMWYIRSGLSAGFLLLGIASIKNKLQSLLFIFLAITFHAGSLLVIFLYSIFYFSIDKKLKILVLLPLIFLAINYITRNYLSDEYITGIFSNERSLNIKSIVGMIFAIYIIIKSNIFLKKYRKEIITLSLLCFLMPFLFISNDVGTRFRQFLFPIDGIAMCIIFKDIFGNYLWPFAILIVSVTIAYFFWSNDYNKELFLPYNTWFLN